MRATGARQRHWAGDGGRKRGAWLGYRSGFRWEAHSCCKEGKRVSLEREAAETGGCCPYCCVRGGESMEQRRLPPEEEGPCPLPHHCTGTARVTNQAFHSYTSKSISPLEKKTKAWQAAGFVPYHRKGQGGTWKFWTQLLHPHALV